MAEDLDTLIESWFDELVEENPVRATSLGIDGHDDRLGEYTAADFERRAAADGRWLERVRAIGDEGLSLDERIDRDLLVSHLRGSEVMQDWAVWRRDPATYLNPCLSGVFSLFLNRLHPEAELAASAAARLRQVPAVVEAGRSNLDPQLASPIFVQRGLGACRAGIAYARDLVPREVEDEKLRAELAEAGELAAGALEGFAVFLEELAATAQGPYAIGEELYSALLTEKELLGYGAAEMRTRGQAAYDELSSEMAELARQIDPSSDGDWAAVVESLNRDHPATPEAMRQEYEDWTERARKFLHDTGLVTMPDGERCLVEPSPHFQRPVLAVASYSQPPAFKPSMTGHFFVPYPPEGVSEEEVQKRLETNSRHSIPTISVHEAYPGHHWHLVWMQANPRLLRKVIGTSYFAEGWALYAEQLLREHGFFSDPRQELCQLDARIFRAARIVVDTSLHMGDMDFEEAVTFMSTKASLSEPAARAEVGRYCSWPTQASSYLTGSLEIERIRERYLSEGKGDLRSFNDTIAGSGFMPIALAERAVMGG